MELQYKNRKTQRVIKVEIDSATEQLIEANENPHLIYQLDIVDTNNNKFLYIGQTQDIINRLATHHAHKQRAIGKVLARSKDVSVTILSTTLCPQQADVMERVAVRAAVQSTLDSDITVINQMLVG